MSHQAVDLEGACPTALLAALAAMRASRPAICIASERFIRCEVDGAVSQPIGGKLSEATLPRSTEFEEGLLCGIVVKRKGLTVSRKCLPRVASK